MAHKLREQMQHVNAQNGEDHILGLAQLGLRAIDRSRCIGEINETNESLIEFLRAAFGEIVALPERYHCEVAATKIHNLANYSISLIEQVSADNLRLRSAAPAGTNDNRKQG